jgi:hypothetical protein
MSRRDDVVRLRKENLQWREFAWLSCPHRSAEKSGDGEMMCRDASFRHDKIETLSEHLRLARQEGVHAAYESAARELFPDPPDHDFLATVTADGVQDRCGTTIHDHLCKLPRSAHGRPQIHSCDDPLCAGCSPASAFAAR